MYNLIKEYKDISLRIISEIKTTEDQDKISLLLDKRQQILDKVTESNQIQRFRIQYAQNGLDKIDEEMRILLTELLNKTKEELRVHRKKKNASNAYVRSTKSGGNIFTVKS